MSILIYKQRHEHPNKKKSAKNNYAYVRYIATRPRVLKNEGMSHGLFGKLEVGEMKEFQDWKEIANLVYAQSKEKKIFYRGIISFLEETANELGLVDGESWKRYMEKHIGTIAEKNKIKRENFAYVCSVHEEQAHPHIHIVFWDQSDGIRNAFTSPKIPNAIRLELIKHTFQEQILNYAKEKDLAVKSMRSMTNEIVEGFSKELGKMRGKEYKKMRMYYGIAEQELAYDFHFTDQLLNMVADHILRIHKIIPKNGRIAYQFVPEDVKEEVNKFVRILIGKKKEIKELVDTYVETKMKIISLYESKEEVLASKKEKYQKEAEKIIANRVLSMVKHLNRMDYEEKGKEYALAKREYQVTQFLYAVIDLLERNKHRAGLMYEEQFEATKDLSKEARKELYLKYQDKGYEY